MLIILVSKNQKLFKNSILGYSMSPDEGQEEYEEVQKTLSKQENEVVILALLFCLLKL